MMLGSRNAHRKARGGAVARERIAERVAVEQELGTDLVLGVPARGVAVIHRARRLVPLLVVGAHQTGDAGASTVRPDDHACGVPVSFGIDDAGDGAVLAEDVDDLAPGPDVHS